VVLFAGIGTTGPPYGNVTVGAGAYVPVAGVALKTGAEGGGVLPIGGGGLGTAGDVAAIGTGVAAVGGAAVAVVRYGGSRDIATAAADDTLPPGVSDGLDSVHFSALAGSIEHPTTKSVEPRLPLGRLWCSVTSIPCGVVRIVLTAGRRYLAMVGAAGRSIGSGPSRRRLFWAAAALASHCISG
jgi:hypothetical protein